MQKRESLIAQVLTICLIFCFISVKSQVAPPGKRIQNEYFHGTWVGDYDDFNEAVFKFKQNGSTVELDRGHDDGWKWYGQITNGVLKYYETKVVKNSGTYIYNYEFRLLNDGHTMECKYSGITGKNFKTMKLRSTYLTKNINKDNDQDQVLNEFDICPNTPKGLSVSNGGVDLRGCQVLQNQNQQADLEQEPLDEEDEIVYLSEFDGHTFLFFKTAAAIDAKLFKDDPNKGVIEILKYHETFIYRFGFLWFYKIHVLKGKVLLTEYNHIISTMPGTVAYIDEYMLEPDMPRKANEKYHSRTIVLKPGRCYLTVIKGPSWSEGDIIKESGVKSSYVIQTPTATAGVRGTKFEVVVNQDKSTNVYVYEGVVDVKNDVGSTRLTKGMQADVETKNKLIVQRNFNASLRYNNEWAPAINKAKSRLQNTNNNGSQNTLPNKIPYPLPQAKWVKQNTIDGYYTTAISSSGKEEMVFITGSISSSQYAPNVHRIYYHQKSLASHNMGSDANGIFALDKKKLWICGKRGGIAFSENTALEAFWKNQKSGTSLDLNAIYFNDEKNGWCVGNNGIVLYTKNGGNSWNVKSGFIRKHLVGVQFVDNKNGWILCNGTYYPSEMPLIYYTTDGGNNWHPTEVAAGLKNSRMAVNAMWFIDENNGWIVGANNLIMFTKDGGVSWNYYKKAQQGGTNLHDIQFTDPWNGWICGEKGLLMHTIDGGKTWKKESINNETGTFTSLQFNGPYIGWVITNNQIYQYKDEKLYNQFRSKFINGEWDTWSNISKIKKDDNIVPKRKQNQIDVNNKAPVPKKKNIPTSNKKNITKPKNNNSNINNNSFAELWSLNSYNNNIESFKQNVTTKTNKGFVPVGLNCTNSQYEVLYLGGGVLSITAWNMEWYNDANSLQQGINKNMNQGYIPSGFSWNGNAYYVFYIKTNFNGKAWQIVPSALDLNAVSNAIKPFVDQKYTPMGITIFGDEYYTLLVQFDTPLANNWFIEGYNDKRSEIVKNINKKLPDGTVPWGILKSSGVANILYIGI